MNTHQATKTHKIHDDRDTELKKYLSAFIDNEPPLISGHEDGTICFGCEKCFIPNPKFKGYKQTHN